MSALARYDIDALAEQIFKESIVVINQEEAGVSRTAHRQGRLPKIRWK